MRAPTPTHSPVAFEAQRWRGPDARPTPDPGQLDMGRDGGQPGARMSALRCLVVDDQPGTLDRLTRMLRAHPAVGQVSTASEALAAVRTLGEGDVDVAFVEVRMPDMSGLELAWMIKRLRRPPAVVFATRCPTSAADAFDVGAVDYVCKPLRPERLAESLRRVVAARCAAGVARPGAAPESVATARPVSTPPGTGSTIPVVMDASDETIPVKLGGTTKMVLRSSVRWVQAQGDYARLHTVDGSHLIRARLAALANCWQAAGLIRIHRSYLVQLRFVVDVRMVDSGQMRVVIDGHQLPVSRRLAPRLRSRLLNAARSARRQQRRGPLP